MKRLVILGLLLALLMPAVSAEIDGHCVTYSEAREQGIDPEEYPGMFCPDDAVSTTTSPETYNLVVSEEADAKWSECVDICILGDNKNHPICDQSDTPCEYILTEASSASKEKVSNDKILDEVVDSVEEKGEEEKPKLKLLDWIGGIFNRFKSMFIK